MFAVDLLVLSESKEGLQESLNKLLTYCNKWQLSVNYKKTKTMTIGSLNRKPKPNFTYNNNLLENVTCSPSFDSERTKRSTANIKLPILDFSKISGSQFLSKNKSEISLISMLKRVGLKESPW
jgi:hypothetical protein